MRENRAGRPPTSVLLGAGEAVSQFDAGSHSKGCALLPRARGSDSPFPLAPAGDLPCPRPGSWYGRGRRAGPPCRAGRRARSGQGRAGGVRAVPHASRPGRRLQEVRGYATTTSALLALADWLHSLGVTRVVMESTSDYWKGVYWLLETEGFACWLVNARDVKNVPGRPKTDKADAVWLAKVAERGMCRPSLVHPRPIRQLRDLTRYRRAMLEALIAGQRDPKVLAQLARRRLRAKIAALEEALRGFFSDHHAVILRMMLDNIDRLSEQIAALDTTIAEAIAPFAVQVAQLDQITGVGVTAAQELIAELGVDMGRFPSAAHLMSWAKFCPQVHESAGRKKPKGR